ncbi:phosphate/phosphite/phosphonate ABC transporter substrate-binding protein [Paraburkholderia phosphatilytica]|uniref:phosphate/phosphite/phosphonate ABC transporter substrate-binding protein n=1 Tax=Paraburkholderia phosphatilytica TaxID=2282883 RepID=UPI000E4EEB76|nr:PhnD/SsuA/transferrin family substrate-binding protein [Paraburkholderia phosphatilytica]
MTWIAALPMYNVTPALADDWRALLADVLRAVASDACIVSQSDDLPTLWRAPNLLLSQTCGYPLTHDLNDADVQVVATPRFDVEGYEGARYSSAIVVHADARYASIEALRNLRAAYNQDDSHSGMNALRHTVAPFADKGRFFSEAIRTGSHVGSLRAIAERRADVAAIDCVTMDYVREALPAVAREVRTLGYTRAAPGLPLIASRQVPAETIKALRAALEEAVQHDAARATRLHLRGFSTLTLNDYDVITRMEDEARAAGYPRLA